MNVKPRKCGLRGCQNKLAKRNRTGFCRECQLSRQADIRRASPAKARAYRVYQREYARKVRRPLGSKAS